MAQELVSWVIRESGIKSTSAFAVAIVLAEHASKQNGYQSWPSRATIAELARVSERTAVRALRELEEAGVIMRGNQGLVANYRADKRPVVYRMIGYINMIELSTAGCHRDTSEPSGVSLCHERGVTVSRAGCHGDTQTCKYKPLNKTVCVTTVSKVTGEPVDNFLTHTEKSTTPNTARVGDTADRYGLSHYPATVATELARHITEAETTGTNESIINDAVTEWKQRTPAAPGLLPLLIADRINAQSSVVDLHSPERLYRRALKRWKQDCAIADMEGDQHPPRPQLEDFTTRQIHA